MKTKHIVQQVALVITLGVAASAQAQLLGGRGGIGGSLGGMVGGAGNIGSMGQMGGARRAGRRRLADPPGQHRQSAPAGQRR